MSLRIKLIENWKDSWKFWSVRFNALATVLMTYLLLVPDAVINMWAMLPADLKSMLPVQYGFYVSLTLYVLSLVSRLIKQQKLEESKK